MSEKCERGVGDGEEHSAESAPAAGTGQRSPKSLAGSGAESATKKWEPNSDLMKLLTSMGISSVTAKKALFYTGNNSAEMATSWIFENPDADLDTPLELEASEETQKSGSLLSDVFKMVFVVNGALDMGVGKIAAQVAHSAIGMHMLLLQNEPKFGDSLMRWFEFGETKIVLKGTSTQHLIELEKKALELGLPTYLVQDAGKTQIKAGSTTVLCIFGRVDLVDKVTGTLRLL
ncbi:putative peptidyl-tRNA hydrolase 2-like protein [Dinothrombium tinctorium]|uniref:peptidyl-tRNA hydrolase n=1 Tax=Dinothrombium tinctorium TaxID=1965070 RepID=A0A443QH76_9ACAR|nr:putative peptidyl-tRNA hydrolase 2-like protein [Dinothrombium tinctorium]